jgi:glutaminyl-tRNA synthetase
MSKRKIQKLVKDKYVLDWDDPRLYTLVALRRRGVPPEAILAFVGSLGVSTATTNIQVPRFEQVVRQYLENSVPRLLMVLKPLKVVLENVPEDYVLMVEKPLHPKLPALGKSTIPFSRTLYIDADDFRIQDSKDYFRLAPGKTVGLFQGPHSITCVSYKTDPSTGEVIELSCRLEDGSSGPVPPKPKAFIQWVAEHAPSGSPVRVDETRIFHPLFKSDNPAALDNFLSDVNADSLQIISGAFVEVGFWSLAKTAFDEALRDARSRTERALKEEEKWEIPASHEDVKDDTPRPSAEQLIGNECVRFQGLRVAYFALDKDAKLGCLGDAKASPGPSPGDKIILNRIVTLKEDASKKTA